MVGKVLNLYINAKRNHNVQIITVDLIGSRTQSLHQCKDKETNIILYFSLAEFKTTEPDPIGLIMSTSQNHAMS